jgi:hypothetical protein
MFDLKTEIPDFLTEKGNITRLILFTAAFSLVFINVYAPFDVQSAFKLSSWELFVYSSLVILAGVMMVVISRVLMYQVSKKKDLTYLQYFTWILVEICSMALFYTLVEKFMLQDPRFFPELLKISIQNTAWMLLLPYSASWLYFSWVDKKMKLEALAQGQGITNSSKNMIPFYDEKGVLRLSLIMENLIYLEASDNYVNIFYLNKGKISHYMLRNTLKRLEESFKNTDIIRCHRSFMVNCSKVKVIRKDKDGLRLELDIVAANDLPVSKTYVDNVMNAFSRLCPPGDM